MGNNASFDPITCNNNKKQIAELREEIVSLNKDVHQMRLENITLRGEIKIIEQELNYFHPNRITKKRNFYSFLNRPR